MTAVHCRPEEGCITCGDSATPVRVLRVDAARVLALCEDGAGALVTVETGLLEPVAPGEALLVHAGTAIARIDGVATT
jgi:hypothetical protein